MIYLCSPTQWNSILTVPRTEQAARNRSICIRIATNTHYINQNILQPTLVQQCCNGNAQGIKNEATIIIFQLSPVYLGRFECNRNMLAGGDGICGTVPVNQLGDNRIVGGARDGGFLIVVCYVADALAFDD
ncbi:hypothetical protein ACKAV7_009646 [Fusarium commune]|nr:hypothetical protein LZL87_010331 [Fusarium oxysporum]